MSEHSRSVHVRVRDGESIDDAEAAAVAALERAKATGLVLPARVVAHRAPSWITVVVADASRDAFLGEVGLALDYEFAADHGVTATLVEGGRPLGRVQRDFERAVTHVDDDAFVARRLLDAAALAILRRRLAASRGHVVAEALGLNDVASLSGDDLFLDRRVELEKRFPSATFVEDGRAASWAIPRKNARIVLCTLSPKRVVQLRADPDLVIDLLEADQVVPGLLDLGRSGGALARDPRSCEAVLGRRGEPLPTPPGAIARILSKTQVAAIAQALADVDEEEMAPLREHYLRAASRDEAMLVAVD